MRYIYLILSIIILTSCNSFNENLKGKWKRVSDGMIINIVNRGESFNGIILYTSDDSNENNCIYPGAVKWYNIKIVSPNSYDCSNLSKSCDNTEYIPCNIEIYSKDSLILRSYNDDSSSINKKAQKWIRINDTQYDSIIKANNVNVKKLIIGKWKLVDMNIRNESKMNRIYENLLKDSEVEFFTDKSFEIKYSGLSSGVSGNYSFLNNKKYLVFHLLNSYEEDIREEIILINNDSLVTLSDLGIKSNYIRINK